MLESVIRTYVESQVIRKSMPYPSLNKKMLMISTLGRETYLKFCSGKFYEIFKKVLEIWETYRLPHPKYKTFCHSTASFFLKPSCEKPKV